MGSVEAEGGVEWLQTTGAKVTAVDGRATPELQQWAAQLPEEIDCRLGERAVMADRFDLAVVSPGVPLDQPQVASLRARGVPVWGELELGWSASQCPAIAITGTNGKTTTTEWVTQLLSETAAKFCPPEISADRYAKCCRKRASWMPWFWR